MRKVELLSPAGNFYCIYQAIHNGADAVYFSGKKFGARKYADNFDYNEIIEAIKYCHLYGVKVYITVNTIILEEEFDEVIKYVEFLHENNVDAIIVQDLGLIEILKKIFPNLELHASTQCHNHNNDSIEFLKKLGVSRVVLAREMSLDEIKKINIDIEKEMFIHGALCVSYSGCCLFSSMNGGRSGNRGECVGSCRLPYKLYKNGNEVETDGKYLLSTKSLCTIDKIDELIESGVTSFKIEGRMKSPEYVGYVTRLYRQKIDNYYSGNNINVTLNEKNNLKKLYNREFTLGYLFEKKNKEIMNIKTSNHIGTFLGKVIYVDKKIIKILLEDDLYQEDGIRFDNNRGMIINKLYDANKKLVSVVPAKSVAIIDNKINLLKGKMVRKTIDSNLIKKIRKICEKKIKVTMNLVAKIGLPLELTIFDGINKIVEYGDIVNPAINSPITDDRIEEQIIKLGNTPFECHEVILEKDNNIFISIKSLNELRRSAINKLIEKREYYAPAAFKKKNYLLDERKIQHNDSILKINVLVRNEEQLKIVLKEKINNIYVDSLELYNKYKKIKNIFYRTERTENKYRNFKGNNILATEVGAINKYAHNNNVVSDYFLNIINNSSLNCLIKKGVKLVTLSVESSFDNLMHFNKNLDKLEIIIYGRIELMVTKYCPINMIENDDDKIRTKCISKNKYCLKDQYGNMYPIISKNNTTSIMHYKNIDLISDIKQYKALGINNFRIELFDEKEKDILNIIEKVRKNY